jgi:hypothetical protein
MDSKVETFIDGLVAYHVSHGDVTADQAETLRNLWKSLLTADVAALGTTYAGIANPADSDEIFWFLKAINKINRTHWGSCFDSEKGWLDLVCRVEHEDRRSSLFDFRDLSNDYALILTSDGKVRGYNHDHCDRNRSANDAVSGWIDAEKAIRPLVDELTASITEHMESPPSDRSVYEAIGWDFDRTRTWRLEERQRKAAAAAWAALPWWERLFRTIFRMGAPV